MLDGTIHWRQSLGMTELRSTLSSRHTSLGAQPHRPPTSSDPKGRQRRVTMSPVGSALNDIFGAPLVLSSPLFLFDILP